MKILITGSAGFIGSALSLRLLERGDQVIGIDNLNDYYDVGLKRARLARTQNHPGFSDLRVALEDRDAIAAVFREHRPERVVNLAAQAGVRYSIENPAAYIDTNLVGFGNILKGAGTTKWSIWSTPPAVRFTVPIPVCLFRFTTMSTIR